LNAVTAALEYGEISVEDYLNGELDSPVKHEFLGGVIYSMAGATNAHNRIAGNVFGGLFSRLRGNKCQPFNSDTKVRIKLPTHVRFYYPDAMVVCRPNPPLDTFHDEPAVVIEVASHHTRRIDAGEKRDAYLAIPSLEIYMLIEPDRPHVTVWRRRPDGFVREVSDGLDAAVAIPSIGVAFPLADIYEGIDFNLVREEPVE
jgi:Uma2 family endonuclease